MDIDALRIVIEVARRGSFAAVARDRDQDPSSISRIVAAVEEEIGLRLFQRTTRRMALTEVGDLYLKRVEGLVEELDQARDAALAIHRGPMGTLRLTTSVAFGCTCLVPILPRFRQRYPDLKLELLLTDAALDLVAERIDLAIRLGPRIKADLVRVKLFDTRYRVCASPEYLDRVDPPQAPGDLQQHRCLVFDLPEFRSRWRFQALNGEITEVPIEGDVVISNGLAIRACAVAGMGPALLAHWLIDGDLGAGRLVDLFPHHQVTATDFQTAAWILYPSRTFLPNKVQIMMDFLEQNLEQNLS